jgi:hypothetical protein
MQLSATVGVSQGLGALLEWRRSGLRVFAALIFLSGAKAVQVVLSLVHGQSKLVCGRTRPVWWIYNAAKCPSQSKRA